MRFLLGIFTGAALTLLIATTADAPTSPVVNQLSGIWQELIKTTGDRLFRHQPGGESTPQEADSQPLAIPELPGASDLLDTTEIQAGTPAPTPATPPSIEPQLTQSSNPIAALERTPAGDQQATVWVPFHSERSASGFARSLSRHFEYPFSVRRAGPGAYQVIFPYADTAQRETLLLEIAELTGQ